MLTLKVHTARALRNHPRARRGHSRDAADLGHAQPPRSWRQCARAPPSSPGALRLQPPGCTGRGDLCRALFKPANRSLRGARRGSFKFGAEALRLGGRSRLGVRCPVRARAGGRGGPLALSVPSALRTWPPWGANQSPHSPARELGIPLPPSGASGLARTGAAPGAPSLEARGRWGCPAEGLELHLRWPLAARLPDLAGAASALCACPCCGGGVPGDGGTGGLGSEPCSPLAPSSLQ